jgi:chromosome segregation ATPase
MSILGGGGIMSTQLPRLETRISLQERRQIMLDARIEELSEDMTAGFKQQADYQIQTERKIASCYARIEALSEDMTASFRQLASYHTQTERSIDSRFDKIEANIAAIEARMATKEDLAELEARMATKLAELEARMDAKMAELEARMDAKMATMETRLLDAFKQVLVMIESRLPLPQA